MTRSSTDGNLTGLNTITPSAMQHRPSLHRTHPAPPHTHTHKGYTESLEAASISQTSLGSFGLASQPAPSLPSHSHPHRSPLPRGHRTCRYAPYLCVRLIAKTENRCCYLEPFLARRCVLWHLCVCLCLCVCACIRWDSASRHWQCRP